MNSGSNCLDESESPIVHPRSQLSCRKETRSRLLHSDRTTSSITANVSSGGRIWVASASRSLWDLSCSRDSRRQFSRYSACSAARLLSMFFLVSRLWYPGSWCNTISVDLSNDWLDLCDSAVSLSLRFFDRVIGRVYCSDSVAFAGDFDELESMRKDSRDDQLPSFKDRDSGMLVGLWGEVERVVGEVRRGGLGNGRESFVCGAQQRQRRGIPWWNEVSY